MKKIKISNFQTYSIAPRWIFLKLETSDGLVGWGEPIIEGKAETLVAAVSEMCEHIIDQDPFHIEALWQRMYRGNFYRGGPILMSAISGINQALWDIKGKALGVPVHELLGGACRNKIRMYSWTGGDDPKDNQETVQQTVDLKKAGLTAAKMNVWGKLSFIENSANVDKIVSRIASVREAVGKDFDIAIDFHGRVHKSMAKILLKELEAFRPLFVEEPLLPEHANSLPEIYNYTSIPIATGERMFSRYEFRDVLEQRCVDIVQPDISHAGGISECLRIANLAETYDVQLAIHCPLGPIALMAALHVDAVAYNTLIQEQSIGMHYNLEGNGDVLDYIKNKEVLRLESGYVSVPDTPGLGIEIDEETVQEVSSKSKIWHNPVWFYEDGSIAEW